MALPNIVNASRNRKINIICLLVAICVVLFAPIKKEIWYDETISMQCSKGISHDLQNEVPASGFNSNFLNEHNTAANVFDATVKDNANSYLYNISLHWFTQLTSNSLSAYMLLSRLCAVATLIAFFVLCGIVIGHRLFTSIALLLLATDTNFFSMSHEIRAYAMATTFVTIAGVYFFRFIDEKGRRHDLFFLALFAVAAILSHFLSVYIILLLLAAVIYIKKRAFFSLKNIAAISMPVVLLALFFMLAYPGLAQMSRQNHDIQAKTMKEGFNLAEVFARSIKFFALNFKAVFPAYLNNMIISVSSAAAIIGLYVAALKSTNNRTNKRNLHLLFLAGISSSLFLALLCMKSHHYTALYFRYFSFCVPFCCLFTAYALQLVSHNPRLHIALKGAATSIIVLPSITLFILSMRNTTVPKQYNHSEVAGEIVAKHAGKLSVPKWKDALLMHCLLPRGYKIDYVRNEIAPYFTLYSGNGEEHIPVIRKEEGSK